MQKYEVVVSLKPEVLDPEGRAIQGTLKRLGHNEVQDIKVSKRFELEVADNTPEDTVVGIAREYLANSVSEQFTLKRLEK